MNGIITGMALFNCNRKIAPHSNLDALYFKLKISMLLIGDTNLISVSALLSNRFKIEENGLECGCQSFRTLKALGDDGWDYDSSHPKIIFS